MNKYYFFYSGPFSNWYKCGFWDLGREYNCVEQYMMAHKALLFDDLHSFGAIMQSNSPRDIKELGRKVSNFNPYIWDNFKYNVVFKGCLQKFSQNGVLRQDLLYTGDSILVEASPVDRVWGIGFSADDAVQNYALWGENLLGKVLTEVKTFLQ